MVSPIFTLSLRHGLTRLALGPARAEFGGRVLEQTQFVVDREAYEGAAALLDTFGESALAEAATRAERSRDVGNHIHYTRWCRVGRAILVLGDPQPAGMVH
jgi:hypothetical protein